MEPTNSILDYSFVNFVGTESLLTTSQYAKVVFLNVAERYGAHADLVCEYSLSTGFTVRPGDRIVLYRLGWQHVTDYVLFDWVDERTDALRVVFEASKLPRNYVEFYQLCYIGASNAIFGASVPFQFYDGCGTSVGPGAPVHSLKALDADDAPEADQDEQSRSPPHTDTLLEIARLKSANDLLRENLIETQEMVRGQGGEMRELRAEMDALRSALTTAQQDVADLKQRIQLAGDEYRKLYVDKYRAERKYEKLLKKTKRDSECSSLGDLGDLEPLPPLPAPLSSLPL